MLKFADLPPAEKLEFRANCEQKRRRLKWERPCEQKRVTVTKKSVLFAKRDLWMGQCNTKSSLWSSSSLPRLPTPPACWPVSWNITDACGHTSLQARETADQSETICAISTLTKSAGRCNLCWLSVYKVFTHWMSATCESLRYHFSWLLLVPAIIFRPHDAFARSL